MRIAKTINVKSEAELKKIAPTVGDMRPGDSGWIIPWIVGNGYVPDDYEYHRGNEPLGTSSLKVTMTHEGLILDYYHVPFSYHRKMR